MGNECHTGNCVIVACTHRLCTASSHLLLLSIVVLLSCLAVELVLVVALKFIFAFYLTQAIYYYYCIVDLYPLNPGYTDIVVHAISYGTEWRFRRTFLPLSGRERIDLDLG